MAPENSIKVIVGNKNDLYEFEDIPENEILKYAEQNDFSFFKTSAKSSVGVNQLFHQIGKKFLTSLSGEEITSITSSHTKESINSKKSKIKGSMLETSKLSIKTLKKSKRNCC